MDNKYFDFDQFMAEKEEIPVIIKIFGVEEHLPSSLPADVVLKVIAMQKNPNAVISDAQMFGIATKVFGDKLQTWCDKGLTTKGLEILIKETMALYTEQKQVKTTKAKVTKIPKQTP